MSSDRTDLTVQWGHKKSHSVGAQTEAGTVNLANPSHWGGQRPRAAGQFVLSHILAHNRARLQPREGLNLQLHPKLSVGVSALGSRFPASRSKSQKNFCVINNTVFGILLQQRKSDQQLPACHGAYPQVHSTVWLLCVRGEDLEGAKEPEREWDIPEPTGR